MLTAVKTFTMPETDITKAVDLSIHAEGMGPKRFRQPVYFLHLTYSKLILLLLY